MCPIGNTLIPQKCLSEGPQTVRGDAFLKAPLLQFLYHPVLSVRLSQLFIFLSTHLQGVYCKLCQEVFKLKLKKQENELTLVTYSVVIKTVDEGLLQLQVFKLWTNSSVRYISGVFAMLKGPIRSWRSFVSVFCIIQVETKVALHQVLLTFNNVQKRRRPFSEHDKFL